jgi:hypothetical protein
MLCYSQFSYNTKNKFFAMILHEIYGGYIIDPIKNTEHLHRLRT